MLTFFVFGELKLEQLFLALYLYLLVGVKLNLKLSTLTSKSLVQRIQLG